RHCAMTVTQTSHNRYITLRDPRAIGTPKQDCGPGYQRRTSGATDAPNSFSRQQKGIAMRPHAAAMKALLDQPGLQVMPGCGDGMGARLIEEAGFRTGFISGSSLAAMRLAMPDMDLLTFPEMA